MAADTGADAARRAAVAALVRVHRGGWANLAAKDALAWPSLTQRDKAFAGALFFGSIERLVTLDWLLAPFLKKPLEKLDVEVRAVLETGLYQMRYMRVPKSAAVNESVKLARAFGKTSAAGLVNAVLRRAADVAETDVEAASFAGEEERVRVVWSVSGAVARAVMEALPKDYDAFLAAGFSGGELCLRTNTLQTAPATLAEALRAKGAEVRPGQLPAALYARLPGGVAGEPLFEAGMYHVQGEASQFACACLGAKKGEKVLDLCAAPGGKSATLAQEMGGGAGLVACDVRENRLPLITKTLKRLKTEGVKTLLNDAAVYNPELEGQDRVLCDVPCSGLGVLGTKPDLRYTDGANFETLPALQLKVLATAARYVKKGGRLVYSTCTIRRQENEGVVRAFLQQDNRFRLVPPPVAPKGARICDEMMTILPQDTDLDGFFVATMERL